MQQMSGLQTRRAMSQLGLTVDKAIIVLGRSRRMIMYYRATGSPPHVSLALQMMLDDELPQSKAKAFLKTSRSRRDAPGRRAT